MGWNLKAAGPAAGPGDGAGRPASRTIPSWGWIAILVWIGYTAALGWLYVHLPPSPDQSVHDYIGWTLTQGGVPYVDAADQNWPGIMFLHAVSTRLFGNHLESFRLFDFLFLLSASCLLLHVFARRSYGVAASFLVIPIYQAMYVSADRWVSGQRDVIAAAPMIAAGLCLLLRLDGGRRHWCAALGICVGLAVLLRPTFLLLGLLLFLWDLGWRRRSGRSFGTVAADHAVAGVSLLGLLGSVALAGLPSGALQAWYETAILFNLEAYAPDSRSWPEIGLWMLRLAARAWHWYLAFAVAGAVVAWRSKRHRPTSVLLLVCLTTLASVFVQKKGLSYHMGPFLPVLALFIATFLAFVLERLAGARQRPRQLAVALLLLALPVLGLAKKIYGTLGPQIAWQAGSISTAEMLDRYKAGETEVGFSVRDAVDAARYVRRVVPPGGTVLVWGRPLLVNFLAERPLTTRFVSFDFMRLTRPPFSLAEAWTAEVRRALAETPPEVIVLFRAPGDEGYLYLSASGETPGPYRAVREAVERGYRRDRSFGTAECFRLRRRAGGRADDEEVAPEHLAAGAPPIGLPDGAPRR